MNNTCTLPKCLLKLEGQVRQLCELTEIENLLAPIFRVPSSDETTTHMAVRLAAEREIQGRKEYLCEFIANAVVNEFKAHDMLSKCPELHTSHNEM